MRHPFLAVIWVTVVLLLPARAAEPADAADETQDSARSGWSLSDGVPMPTLGGIQSWADVRFFHRWRIQRHASSDHYRLLDGHGLRYASGTYAQCCDKLEETKKRRNLPPMRGKAVVVLHGLAGTRLTMALLCRHLERYGDYATFNVSYPSTRDGVAEHARALARVIEGLEGIEEIHFVGHSMGNIVIRHYLADAESGRGVDPRIGRFVMLAPPNHGSSLAVQFADEMLVSALLGESGQQLGREWTWLESELAVPRCEFGIVAGGRGNDRGFNPLVPGDDDGVIAVASTRLPGAADFVRVSALHAILPAEPEVMAHTLNFLQNGRFAVASE